MTVSISPKLPLNLSKEDGYEMIKDYVSMVKQNLKMLILTSPGERVMDPNFGVGLRRFLFEQDNEVTYGDIESKIRQQVKIYLPYLEIEEVSFKSANDAEETIKNNMLSVGITYAIKPLQSFDSINITQSL